MSNESGDIVFDTGVSDHESMRGISKENIVKLFNKSKQDLKGVKREVISKTVNDSRTGSKFLVKRVKCWKDFIISIIHVDERRFQAQFLFGGKIIDRNIVRIMFV